MVGLEIIESKASKRKAHDLRDRIVDLCFESGLLILGCGDNTIRFCPPLIVDSEDIQTAVSILEKVLQTL
jgi:4-aminobutyrate aminotransferase